MKLGVKITVSKKQKDKEKQKLTVDVQAESKDESMDESGSESDYEEDNDEIVFIRNIPTHPRNRLKRQVRNFFQITKRNIDILLENYGSMYGIEAEDKTLRYFVKRHHGKTQYFIFRRICELAVNSNVRTSEKWFDFEIDSE